MAFFRIKKIKGKEYAYLVENEWRRKGSRQKVKGYMGRVYRFDLKNEINFSEFIKNDEIEKYIQEKNINQIISDLIEWELFKFNISKQEFSINLQDKTITKSKNNAVLLINEGFLCNLTLQNLIGFMPETNEEDDGYRFARSFVEAGIKVPQEAFILLFAKIYKIDNKEVNQDG